MLRRFHSALVSIAATGCGDQIHLADAGQPPVDAAECPGPSSFHGIVRAFATDRPFDQFERLADVEVCDADRPSLPCTRTDPTGAYVLRCVPSGEVVLSFERAGYTRSVWLVVAPGSDQQVDATLLTDAQNTAFYAPVSATFPKPGYGTIAANEVTHQDGIQLSAVGAEGPFYSRDGISLDTTVTGTVGDGLAFFIAPLGSLTIEITPTDSMQSCGHALGAFVSTGHGLTVPVYEHTEAGVYVACR